MPADGDRALDYYDRRQKLAYDAIVKACSHLRRMKGANQVRSCTSRTASHRDIVSISMRLSGLLWLDRDWGWFAVIR